MREIEFRAWDKVDGVMWEWPAVKQFKMKELSDNEAMEYLQYTGLKDKNGKKIHEGDIVYREGKGDYVVKWEDKCAGFIMSKDDDSWKWPKKDYQPIYTIMGNIYELLEES